MNQSKNDDEIHQFIVLVKPKTDSELKETVKKSMASAFDPNMSREDIVNISC